MKRETHKISALGLTPLLVFLLSYLLSSIILGDFYKVPITIAFILTSIYAIAITKGESLNRRMEIFSKGASDSNMLLMIWIFILSGAFATSAKEVGAIDTCVQYLLYVMPSYLILPGLFIVSCFVSLSIGTSVGTIVAIAPIALGLSEPLGLSPAFTSGLVVGGAFFGDNLSFISDTTIAATRLLNCRMKDKFKANLRFALPAAIFALVIYTIRGLDLDYTIANQFDYAQLLLVLPYILALVSALMGVNVLIVLLIGIFTTGLVGISSSTIDFWSWIASLGEGVKSVGELIIITLLASGVLEMIKYNGGFNYMLQAMNKRISSQRGAEYTIGALVSFACVCTANNTIAILSVGAVVKDIAERFNIDPKRAASILDIFACIAQSIIPYGAQLLLVASLASVSPVAIIPYLYYSGFLALITFVTIFFGQRKDSKD